MERIIIFLVLIAVLIWGIYIAKNKRVELKLMGYVMVFSCAVAICVEITKEILV